MVHQFLMSTQMLPKPHSWRRLKRREERVRQYYENKSAPRARWTNTGRPRWGSTPANQISNCSSIFCKLGWTGVWFINAKEKCKNTRLRDALMCGFNHGKPRGSIARKRDASLSATYHYLDLAFAHLQVVLIVDVHPLQGAAHALVHSHQEHNCKSTWKV